MTPPMHILQASFDDPVTPTEIAYIMVVGDQSRSKSALKKHHNVVTSKGIDEGQLFQEKAHFKLTVDDHVFVESNDDDNNDNDNDSISTKVDIPVDYTTPKFKLSIECDSKIHEKPSLESLSDMSSISSGTSEIGDVEAKTLPSMCNNIVERGLILTEESLPIPSNDRLTSFYSKNWKIIAVVHANTTINCDDLVLLLSLMMLHTRLPRQKSARFQLT